MEKPSVYLGRFQEFMDTKVAERSSTFGKIGLGFAVTLGCSLLEPFRLSVSLIEHVALAAINFISCVFGSIDNREERDEPVFPMHVARAFTEGFAVVLSIPLTIAKRIFQAIYSPQEEVQLPRQELRQEV